MIYIIYVYIRYDAFLLIRNKREKTWQTEEQGSISFMKRNRERKELRGGGWGLGMEIFLTLSMYMDDGLSSVKIVCAIYVVYRRCGGNTWKVDCH